MKIIKATWENRNIGCDAYEITLDDNDLKCVEKTISEIEKNDFSGCYVTLKCPVGNLEVVHKLEDIEFRFMETQLTVKHDLSNYKIPEKYKRFEYVLVDKELSLNDWDCVFEKITPEMFITDRVYLDPKLSRETSSKRYINWMKDLKCNLDCKIVGFFHKENLVGYSLFKNKDMKIEAIVGGIFPSVGIGLGIPFIHQNLQYVFNNKCSFVTHISSNNQSIVKLYTELGCYLSDEVYVFRKFKIG